MTREYVAAANENFVRYWERIADHHPAGASRTFGTVSAVSTGTPVPVFNRVYVFEASPSDDVARAVSWMDDQGVPYRVTVADSALAATDPTLADLALVTADDPLPGMVLRSLDDVPEPDGRLDVERVDDDEGVETFVTVAAAGFGMSADVVREAYPETLLTDDEMLLLVGRVDDDPVATGSLFQQGDVAGVYVIAVVEEFRRQGLGAAMTWAVLRAGRDAAADIGVLQSSSLGYSVYEGIGFETVVRYHQFHPA